MATQAPARDRSVLMSLAFLQKLLEHCPLRDFAIRFWEGSTWNLRPGSTPAYTLVLKHPAAVRKMFWPPGDLTLAEAYLHNDFDIEGDIVAFFQLLEHLSAGQRSANENLLLGMSLATLPAPPGEPAGQKPGDFAAQLSGSQYSKERDQQAVSYHYDLSNEFFALFLDPRMVYTCAYFADAGDSLETAQARKLDHVCRKLRLRPGDRLLDIGCGWGGLILHAAQHYGADATGISLSQPQLDLARERIQAAGLADRCHAEHCDYRDVSRLGSFDKVASVGMIEQIGEQMLPAYFQSAWDVLRPGGVFLNHGITLRAKTGVDRWVEFGHRYVFPDGEISTLSTTLHEAENVGFEVRDVEDLREHYALTLRHWVKRLEAQHDEACRLTNELRYRVFRLYMAGSSHRFQTGFNNLHQVLLGKADQGKSGLPLRRLDWYVNKDGRAFA